MCKSGKLLAKHKDVPNINCGFVQVSDLQYASPSTVSRCGMVYVDPKNLGYNPYWERWVNDVTSKNDRAEFIKLFDKYVPLCISYILEGVVDGRQAERLKTIVPLSNLNMVKDVIMGSVQKGDKRKFGGKKNEFALQIYFLD